MYACRYIYILFMYLWMYTYVYVHVLHVPAQIILSWLCMFNRIHVQPGSAFPGQFALLRSFLMGIRRCAVATPVPQGSSEWKLWGL